MTIPLTHKLIDLLAGHGVPAELRDGFAYVPSVDRWATLRMTSAAGETPLMEIRATATGDEVVADRWAAPGKNPDECVRDGLAAFCLGGFHVLLAALWGVFERDQVDRAVRLIGAAEWDVYLGGYTTRVSAGVARLTAPMELVDLVVAALDGHLVRGETHALRVYVAVVNGKVTFEALVDDEPSGAVEAAVRSAPWVFPAAGFASLRWFVVARRRTNGPPQLIERTCSTKPS